MSVRNNILVLCVILHLLLTLVNCQWPQQKFDEFRTNKFNFRKSHANWENANICAGCGDVYFGDFKQSLVFSSKQGKAFSLVSDMKNAVKIVQVDLQTGLSTRITEFPGLPASVSASELTQSILTSSEVYVNVLTLNYTFPIIVKFDTLNNFKAEFRVLKMLQDGSVWDTAYSERHDILVIISTDQIIGVKLSSLEIVWQVNNRIVMETGSMLLVPNEYGDGNDMIYIGGQNYVFRLRVLTGQPTSPIFSNQEYTIVSMSYLGIPGWIAAASVQTIVSGGDYLSVINVEKSFGKQSVILFNPWVAQHGNCASPTANVTKLDSNNFVFDIRIVCSDAKAIPNLIGITSKADNIGNIEIQKNYNFATRGYGLAALGNGISVSRIQDYVLVNSAGQVNKQISSKIEGVEDCAIAASTNSKIYSVCISRGVLSMESVDF